MSHRQLLVDLDHRRLIVTAEGMLSWQYPITISQAHRLLLWALATGLPPLEVANWLIATGTLP